MAVPDRLEELKKQTEVTGIDFVFVHEDQTVLDVFFHVEPDTVTTPLVNDIEPSDIHITSPSGGEEHPVVPVSAVQWPAPVGGRRPMRIVTEFPGDFSLYRLRIDDERVDRYFNDVLFSFKANCESDLDCRRPPRECAPDPSVDFPIDYTARDFWSLRQALLDFASERHPHWRDRLEADVGMMLAEVMSGLGDEFHYIKDRVLREAYFETATQRRSLRRHAALVDYALHDGLGATTWLDFQVAAVGTIAAGTPVTEAGTAQNVWFEVGRGFAESFAVPPAIPKAYSVNDAINRLFPHRWDEDDVCLPRGATEVFVQGHHAVDLGFDDFPAGQPPGKRVLLVTTPASPELPARAHVVRLIELEESSDPLLPDPATGTPPAPVTRIKWEDAQATPFEMDLTVFEVHGNLLPATAGRTVGPVRFSIRTSTDPEDRPPAVERAGPDRLTPADDEIDDTSVSRSSVAYLFSLELSDQDDLVYLGRTPGVSEPEVRLAEVQLVSGVWQVVPDGLWRWRRTLLGTNSAQATSKVFTLDDGMWRRVAGFRRLTGEFVHQDYATQSGKTIRFGDGEFGLVPADGTIFQVVFRLGGGTAGNAPARTLRSCAHPLVATVSNPLAVTNGVDAESPTIAKQLAPDAFRAVTFRAVKPEDYAEAAERLPWVQRAGGKFRWTGSWLAAFVTPDPKGSFTVAPELRRELDRQLDRFRQAGRPAHSLDPHYVHLDLEIAICVAESAYRGQVEARVLEALFGRVGIRPALGFFSPDNFTFGTPLDRSRLESAIQHVEGVKAVEEIRIRRRGLHDFRAFDELTYAADTNEVIRVENNRLLPERGSVKLEMRGGA